eukprot:369888-Ditylum_brightwellii.AAC.1
MVAIFLVRIIFCLGAHGGCFENNYGSQWQFTSPMALLYLERWQHLSGCQTAGRMGIKKYPWLDEPLPLGTTLVYCLPTLGRQLQCCAWWCTTPWGQSLIPTLHSPAVLWKNGVVC